MKFENYHHLLTEPKFGRAKRIKVWINGEGHCYEFSFNPKNFRSWTSILLHITNVIQPYFGAVRKLIALSTMKLIDNFEDLDTNEKYIAMGSNCKFKLAPGGYKTSSEKDLFVKQKVQKRFYTGEINLKNLPFLLETGKKKLTIIYMCVNGRSVQTPQKVVLNENDMKEFSLIKTYLSKILDIPEGIQDIYTIFGDILEEPRQIQHGYLYVAVPFKENFIMMDYEHLFNDTNKFRNNYTITIKPGTDSTPAKNSPRKKMKKSTHSPRHDNKRVYQIGGIISSDTPSAQNSLQRVSGFHHQKTSPELRHIQTAPHNKTNIDGTTCDRDNISILPIAERIKKEIAISIKAYEHSIASIEKQIIAERDRYNLQKCKTFTSDRNTVKKDTQYLKSRGHTTTDLFRRPGSPCRNAYEKLHEKARAFEKEININEGKASSKALLQMVKNSSSRGDYEKSRGDSMSKSHREYQQINAPLNTKAVLKPENKITLDKTRSYDKTMVEDETPYSPKTNGSTKTINSGEVFEMEEIITDLVNEPKLIENIQEIKRTKSRSLSRHENLKTVDKSKCSSLEKLINIGGEKRDITRQSSIENSKLKEISKRSRSLAILSNDDGRQESGTDSTLTLQSDSQFTTSSNKHTTASSREYLSKQNKDASKESLQEDSEETPKSPLIVTIKSQNERSKFAVVPKASYSVVGTTDSEDIFTDEKSSIIIGHPHSGSGDVINTKSHFYSKSEPNTRHTNIPKIDVCDKVSVIAEVSERPSSLSDSSTLETQEVFSPRNKKSIHSSSSSKETCGEKVTENKRPNIPNWHIPKDRPISRRLASGFNYGTGDRSSNRINDLFQKNCQKHRKSTSQKNDTNEERVLRSSKISSENKASRTNSKLSTEDYRLEDIVTNIKAEETKRNPNQTSFEKLAANRDKNNSVTILYTIKPKKRKTDYDEYLLENIQTEEKSTQHKPIDHSTTTITGPSLLKLNNFKDASINTLNNQLIPISNSNFIDGKTTEGFNMEKYIIQEETSTIVEISDKESTTVFHLKEENRAEFCKTKPEDPSECSSGYATGRLCKTISSRTGTGISDALSSGDLNSYNSGTHIRTRSDINRRNKTPSTESEDDSAFNSL